MLASLSPRSSTPEARGERRRGCIAVVTVALGLGWQFGCSSDVSGEAHQRVTVATSFAPLDEIVTKVGGDDLAVLRLLAPGQEAHDAELTAKQVDSLAKSNAVVVLGDGFQPTIDNALDGLGDVNVVDALAGITLHFDETTGDNDPHVWMDPANMIAMTHTVVDALAQLDPAHAAGFRSRGDSYIATLEQLGTEMDTAARSCTTRTLVTNHDAFGYLARRMGLETLAVRGISPEADPSASRLEEVARIVAEGNVTTLFVESSLPTDIAATVAQEVNANVATLDPVETFTRAQLDKGIGYIQVQRANLAAIAAGLGCS